MIKEITENLKSRKRDLEAMGEEAIRLIVVRTRLGYGVDRPRAKRKRLKSLSPSYIEVRKGKIAFFTLGKGQKRRIVSYVPDKKPELSEFTRPTRSNLTFTGKMLDSMRVKDIVVRRNRVSIGPDRRSRGKGLTNEKIATYQEQMGRVFNNLSDLEVKKLARFHKKSILRSVDRARR